MVVQKYQAWVTSVQDDEDVEKAIVLAGSLRRVLTTKRIVALYNSNVSENSRNLLRDKFDLAICVDVQVPNNAHPRDFMKIFAFSLQIFQKCVYLSTSTMVLQNCDELFDISAWFAACKYTEDNVETSVYLFTPSYRQYRTLKNSVSKRNGWKEATPGSKGEKFSGQFEKWIMKQKSKILTLDVKYNQAISLLEEMDIYDGLHSDLGIVNFVDVHPMEIAEKIISSSITTLGAVESFVADKWLTIYLEEVRTNLLNTDEDGQPETGKNGMENEPIAIIGMACRYPGGSNSPDEFWNLLSEGRDGVGILPEHRWTNDRVLYHASNRNVRAGFMNVKVDEFDAKFFGVSPKEAVLLDPQQRLLHEVTWEGLEDAGIDPLSLRGSHASFFVGSWIHDYKDMTARVPGADFYRIYLGNSIASGSARLSYFFGTTGPSISTESGCSSAIVAVDMAIKHLRASTANSKLAIACGVNVLLHPWNPFDSSSSSILSFVVAPDGKCKTFSSKANGFGRAEGCGCLVLKRMTDAVKDGDKIWGILRGSAVTQEGVSKSLGTPTIYAESLAMELALKDADVDPKDVSFVEAHGTGTPVGDPMEVAAICKAYHSPEREVPLIIGSVKTNIGHTESTSGIAGIMKVILSLKHQVIPRHLNFESLNPDIDIEAIPAVIPVKEMEWPRVAGKPRIAGVSSFGISGTDGHVIVQEAPDEQNILTSTFKCAARPLHIMKISAKTPESLDQLIQKHVETLQNGLNEINFSDYAYTANVGRATFNHRAFIVAKDTQDAVAVLKQNVFERKEIQCGEGKLCFLFTGQGSQYPGMAAELYKSSPIFRMSFDKCDRILRKRHNISIMDALWITSENTNLNRTLFSQTSIFCVEYALLKLWGSWGIKPDYVLGHSLGEFAAAVAAGALSLKSALKLVAERSRLIDQLPPGKMIVIRMDVVGVMKLLKEFTEQNPTCWLDYAALNSFDQTVLAGGSNTVEKFEKFCHGKGTTTIILGSTHAFHSRHMVPIMHSYGDVASKIKPSRDSGHLAMYISGVDGKVIVDKGELLKPDYWVRHLREKVCFIEACKAAHAENCTYFLEIGPHPILSALAMANIDSSSVKCFPSLRRNKNDWETILESAGKIFLTDWAGSFNWKGMDEYFQRKKLSLPFYPFQRKKIWADVIRLPDKIHPLLGSAIRNASNVSLFENTLTVKQAPYLNDHMIGSSIVFPGAGFLEMLLVAGYSHVQCVNEQFTLPRRPILLRDMKIESPLGMDEGKATALQLVVELVKENGDFEQKNGQELMNGYKVKVFHLHRVNGGEDGHWVGHASGMFVPFVDDQSNLSKEQVNIKEIQENWVETTGAADLYQKLPEIGLRFGATFQSLEKGWRKFREEGDKNETVGLLISVKVPEDADKYLAHPVLVDAMIQCAILWTSTSTAKEKVSKKLQVPVYVKEFIWLRTSNSPTRYVHAIMDTKGTVQVTMVDGDGIPLMILNGVDFVETTATVVESIITSQSSQFATLWEEVWHPRPGPLEMGVEQVDGHLFPEDLVEKVFAWNKLDPENLAVYHHLDQLTVIHFLKALYELGWKPICGDKFTLQGLMANLNINDAFKNFTRFFMKALVAEGHLVSFDPDSYTIPNPLPTNDQLAQSSIYCQTTTENESSRADFKLINEVGNNLPDILQGKVPPLSILFPEHNGLVNSFYEMLHAIIGKPSDVLINSILNSYSEARKRSGAQNPTQRLRILEVGAGTGVHTKLFLDKLKGLDYEYYFTDLSPSFFGKAQIKFSDFVDHMKFQKFNLEECPMSQGFWPGYFDLVIACEVLHATRNIKETLSNLRLLLRDKGHIQILETTAQDRRITFTFGLLDGYWRFQDFDLRPDHACISTSDWKVALRSTGFDPFLEIPSFESVHSTIFATAIENYYPQGRYIRFTHPHSEIKRDWLVFGDESVLSTTLVQKLHSLGRNVILLLKSIHHSDVTSKEYIEQLVSGQDSGENKNLLEGIIYLWGLVEADVKDQKDFLIPLLYLSQFLWDNQKMCMKVFVLTQGICGVDDSGPYGNPSPSTVAGVSKVIRTETSLFVKYIDVPSNKSPDEYADQVFYELWYHEDNEDTIAYREEGDKRFCPRLATTKISNKNLSLPKGTDRFQLVLPATRIVQDLEFAFLNCYALEEQEIEVKVKAAALNFRDVFCILKPVEQFEKINAVGTDFAGVVTKIGSRVTKWKVGDSVFGCNLNDQQALPSHIKISEETVIRVPDHFTFAEAATLPAVFSTAFYCLVTVANIKAGDTVLIHTGSGGVGLSAIQICQHFGANIIATAGSERKRSYLKSLGIQYVFHSRNTDYGNLILEVTSNKGVDIVLNSLTGPGFKEATLQCCAANARFVEMSKLSIWKPEEVKALRSDVVYTIADLTTLEEQMWRELFKQMKDFVNEGVVKPIPYVRFDAVNIRSALSYLQKAKHVGKIVCIMPEIKLENSKFSDYTPMFNDRSTYLITGGITGGIGLETAKYMLSQGAKYLVLVGRNEPNQKTKQLLSNWTDAGYHVNAWQADVGDRKQCQDILSKINDPVNGLPPLRGIMHAAGTLSDGTLPNQTWEKFELTFQAKVYGSWNLHELTAGYHLEHFVFFSSLAGIFGTPGQANHTAGNFYEDALAHYRHSLGQPATTIDWGPWGQTGIATEVEVPGIRPLNTQQGISTMDLLLRTNRLQTGVMDVNSFAVFSKFCPRIKNYIDDRSLFAEVKGPVLNVNSDEFWEEIDSFEERSEKEEVFCKYIKILIRSILKMESEETIEDNAEFSTLGVDSLMMLEMKNNLQNLFGSRMTVSASDLKGCNTTSLLANKLVDILLCCAAAEQVLPTLEELKILMKDDTYLPDKVCAANPGVASPSEIKTIFVTGATGMLAPYIIRLISNMPQITRVVCLVRKRAKMTGEERLMATLQANGLISEILLDKVECVEGDICQSCRLGLNEKLYEELADSMDAIIHCSAKVDHLQLYRKTGPQEKFHLRNVNVLGTRNMLQFATYKKTKYVFHASTFAMIYSMDEEKGCLSEKWEALPAPQNVPINNGYTISKYVAEQLVKQAVERGVPCKSFRFPFIAGDSKTGWHSIEGNHASLRFLTYLKLNVMPETPVPIVELPVDYCAEVAVRIFFNEQAPHEVYNVIPKQVVLEQEFVKIAETFGYKVGIVEYSEFVEKLKSVGEESPIHAFMELYQDETRMNNMSISPAIPSMEHFLSQNLQIYFYSEKVHKYCPDLYERMEEPVTIVTRDLEYLKNVGIFQKFGLE